MKKQLMLAIVLLVATQINAGAQGVWGMTEQLTTNSVANLRPRLDGGHIWSCSAGEYSDQGGQIFKDNVPVNFSGANSVLWEDWDVRDGKLAYVASGDNLSTGTVAGFYVNGNLIEEGSFSKNDFGGVKVRGGHASAWFTQSDESGTTRGLLRDDGLRIELSRWVQGGEEESLLPGSTGLIPYELVGFFGGQAYYLAARFWDGGGYRGVVSESGQVLPIDDFDFIYAADLDGTWLVFWGELEYEMGVGVYLWHFNPDGSGYLEKVAEDGFSPALRQGRLVWLESESASYGGPPYSVRARFGNELLPPIEMVGDFNTWFSVAVEGNTVVWSAGGVYPDHSESEIFRATWVPELRNAADPTWGLYD